MDAWLVFSGLKLFLDIIDGGPTAVAKGILMAAIPGSHYIEAGQVLYELWNLNGSHVGAVAMSATDEVQFADIELLNEGFVRRKLAELDLCKLKEHAFATRSRVELPHRELMKPNWSGLPERKLMKPNWEEC